MDTIRRLEWKDVFDTVRGYLFRYHKAGDDRIRPSAGSDNADLHAENSRAVVSTVYGNTVKFNQLVQNGDFSDGINNWYSRQTGGIITNNGVGSFIKKVNTYNNCITTPLTIINGHKYYIALKCISSGGNTCTLQFAQNESMGGSIQSTINIRDVGEYKYIFTANNNFTYGGFTGLYDNVQIDATILSFTNLQIFDLTLLGIDNLTTTDQVEAWLALNVGTQDYYPYDAGSLISFGGTAIKSVGFNQWDEEIEDGAIDSTGVLVPSTTRLRSKNYIPVFPGTVYYSKGGVGLDTFYYDINKKFISARTWSTTDSTFTTPSNCYYIKIAFNKASYNHDICINLSCDKNGTYEPYDGSPERTCDLSFVPNIGFETFNIWDGTYTVIGRCIKSDGSVVSAPNYNITDFFPIKPSTQYYLKNIVASDASAPAICWYDSNKEFISGIANAGQIYNKVVTTPPNAAYAKSSMLVETASTACINESVAGLNGMYLPYGTPYYLFPDGQLKSAGSVSDEVSATTATRKLSAIDLGTLTWGTYYHLFTASQTQFVGLKAYTPNTVCGKYIIGDSQTDKSYYISGSNFVLYDSSLSSSDIDSQGKISKLSGVMFYYEITTPITISHNNHMNYKVDKYSTEELIVPTSVNGEPTSTAINADIDYQYRG